MSKTSLMFIFNVGFALTEPKKNPKTFVFGFPANNPNFDTNAPLFEVRGKVILEGVMHHIRPINLDLRL